MTRLWPPLFLILFFLFQGPVTIGLAGEISPALYGLPSKTPAANTDLFLPEARYADLGERPSSPPTVPECLFCLDYGTLVLSDTRHVLSAPLRWEREAWLRFSVAALGVGVVALLDKPVFEAVQRHPHTASNRIANIFEPFGAQYALGILGIFYLDGLAFDHPEATAVAQDGVAASLIGPGLLCTTLKLFVGRSRPDEDEGTHAFHPFSGNSSFPSFHTAEAFTVASVISAHYPLPWVEVVSYGTAGLVGFSRIVHHAHFTSDVVAGALIGAAVGNSVVHFNQQGRTGFQINPLLGPELRGVAVALSF